MKREFLVTVIVEPDEDGFYAYCPGLPGVHAGGQTRDEAIANARDGALAVLRTKLRYGDPIKEGPDLQILDIPPDKDRLSIEGERITIRA
ncbi:MAG: Uncharacterized protein XD60_1421 [Acetothermia bacterium 64_32]|nr:MAG: Uncharacterized protein XD60_1421 [Acetothermia bacterium 64_32]